MKKISLYVHIPFCEKKCFYCDFLSAPASVEEMENYVNYLLREIREQSLFYGDRQVVSIFFGGGTPSILSSGEIVRILQQIRKYFLLAEDVEITLECNPGTVTSEKLYDYIACGINRLSIGLQSTDDEELARIGRIHDYAAFLKTYSLAREAGFCNINIDLMAGLPGQSAASYMRTLERVTALHPEHISAYSLILEEGTWLYVNQSSYEFPDEEEDRKMYRLTGERLEEAGFYRYEISNYAREGWECRHNKVYWRRGDYAGFGLGASSMVSNIRWKNPEAQQDYVMCVKRMEDAQECTLAGSAFVKYLCKTGFHEVQVLTREEQMEEFMFLGLRLTEGVDRGEFKRLFGECMDEIYEKPIDKFLSAGLLKQEGERLRLTRRGVDLSNVVFTEFLF